MVAGAIAGNISAEATTPTGNSFAEAMRGMKPLALSSYKVAKDLGVSIPTVNEMVRERRAVTAAMALRLARYFGTTPHHWQNLQAEFDLELARRKVGGTVTKRIKPLSRRALQELVVQRAYKKAARRNAV